MKWKVLKNSLASLLTVEYLCKYNDAYLTEKKQYLLV